MFYGLSYIKYQMCVYKMKCKQQIEQKEENKLSMIEYYDDDDHMSVIKAEKMERNNIYLCFLLLPSFSLRRILYK